MRGIKVFIAIVLFLVSFACLILGISTFADTDSGNGAGVFYLIITGITTLIGINIIKISNIKHEPKEELTADEDTTFNGRKTREPYYHKEDGKITEIAKLCIDKPYDCPEIIYIKSALIGSHSGNMTEQKREDFNSIEEANDWLKDMSFKPIKNDVQIEELELTIYIEWFYK